MEIHQRIIYQISDKLNKRIRLEHQVHTLSYLHYCFGLENKQQITKRDPIFTIPRRDIRAYDLRNETTKYYESFRQQLIQHLQNTFERICAQYDANELANGEKDAQQKRIDFKEDFKVDYFELLESKGKEEEKEETQDTELQEEKTSEPEEELYQWSKEKIVRFELRQILGCMLDEKEIEDSIDSQKLPNPFQEQISFITDPDNLFKQELPERISELLNSQNQEAINHAILTLWILSTKHIANSDRQSFKALNLALNGNGNFKEQLLSSLAPHPELTGEKLEDVKKKITQIKRDLGRDLKDEKQTLKCFKEISKLLNEKYLDTSNTIHEKLFEIIQNHTILYPKNLASTNLTEQLSTGAVIEELDFSRYQHSRMQQSVLEKIALRPDAIDIFKKYEKFREQNKVSGTRIRLSIYHSSSKIEINQLLEQAVKKENLELIKYILQNYENSLDQKTLDEISNNLITLNSQGGNEILQEIIPKLKNINAPMLEEETRQRTIVRSIAIKNKVHLAVESGNKTALELLMRHGCNIDFKKNHLLNHPVAVMFQGPFYAYEGIRNHYNNTQNHFFGTTPLHAAAYLGKTEIVNILLENGANIYQQERITRYRPIHWAIKNGYSIVAKTLFNKEQENPTQPNKGPELTKFCVQNNDNVILPELLKTISSPIDSLIQTALYSQSNKSLKILLEHESKITHLDLMKHHSTQLISATLSIDAFEKIQEINALINFKIIAQTIAKKAEKRSEQSDIFKTLWKTYESSPIDLLTDLQLEQNPSLSFETRNIFNAQFRDKGNGKINILIHKYNTLPKEEFIEILKSRENIQEALKELVPTTKPQPTSNSRQSSRSGRVGASL
ncbi:MAG: ankyrin repeat domain-containing protein [Rickettsiales bacterium]|nr:ankyrin repeat domain-containing protein [Rickettsiales bacterium]